MDAQAHLMNLGWAGPGHALDHHKSQTSSKPHHNHRGLGYDPKSVRTNGSSNGLVKPLLISQRTGRLGIGKNVHEPASGNEWWLAGFERALGNIGKAGSDVSTGTSTPDSGSMTPLPVRYSGKHGGLYGFFAKGIPMAGTLDEDAVAGAERTTSEQTETANQRPKKRKSGEISGAQPTPESQSRADVEDKNGNEYVAVEAFLKERDKDRRRRERKVKSDETTQFAQVGKYFEAVNGGSAHPKSRLNGVSIPQDEDETNHSTPNDTTLPTETKAERRERRRQRREAKAARSAVSSIDTPDTTATSRGGTDDEGMVAEAVRKAERRRRKEARRLEAERRRSSPPFQVM